ncbi:hypothetical protein [Mycolicibacterium sp.]|uniref:hypothetical protein n=1 Tax=Mycolicibacterium sp. TaxID=2320850 RepID=UPI003D0BE590
MDGHSAPLVLAPPLPTTPPAVDTSHASLTDYLNQPVREILDRLGIKSPPAPQPTEPQGRPSEHPDPEPPVAPAAPFDPMQLIQPVTDALSTLGSGQFGNLDPTAILGGITQSLESSGQAVQQALAGVGESWDGAAATAAQAKTAAVLDDGVKVGRQAAELSENLATAAATVAQSRARLIEIVNEFAATIAAIGINIIFPWGIAAAIAAANLAVTRATEVIAETQSTLGAQAAQVTATGAPVDVTAVPQAGARMAATGGSITAAGASPGLLSGIAPLMQLGSTAVSPVMQAVGAATSAATSSTAPQPTAAGALARRTNEGDQRDEDKRDEEHAGAEGGAGAGGGGAGGGFGGVLQPRLVAPMVPTVADTAPVAAEVSTSRAAAPGAGGVPMMGAPLGHGARGGNDGGHTAAQFLHTSDQGDEIVGDLGPVGPSVIGERNTNPSPNLELRI